jgi:hypothetical protein
VLANRFANRQGFVNLDFGQKMACEKHWLMQMAMMT